MTPLAANASDQEGYGDKLVISSHPSGTELLVQLDNVDLAGSEMFERDCLSFSFDSWLRAQRGEPIPEMDCVTSSDVLSDIADIRALPSTHSQEIDELNPEFISAIDAIEAYIHALTPTLQ